MTAFEIAGRKIGYGYPPIISAELSINHGGNLDTALQMIDEVAKAGADAVKLQYFNASDFADADSDKTITYKSQCKDVTENYYQFFKRHEIDYSFLKACKERAKEHELIFHVTPTSKIGVIELSQLGIDAYKIAADMVSNWDMLEEIARRDWDKPIITSTGHCELEDVKMLALTFCAREHIFLHCVSEYPANSAKLWKIQGLKDYLNNAGIFNLYRPLIGYSDHCIGIDSCIRATELGAVWIEKHFVLSHESDAPDEQFSADPQELSELVKAVK